MILVIAEPLLPPKQDTAVVAVITTFGPAISLIIAIPDTLQLLASVTVMVYDPAVSPVNNPDDAPVVFTVGPEITSIASFLQG